MNKVNKNLEALIDEITDVTNRSKAQTKFLLELLDGNIAHLMELETGIKYLFVGYCPGDKIEAQIVLAKFRVHRFIYEACSLALGDDKFKNKIEKFSEYFVLATRTY